MITRLVLGRAPLLTGSIIRNAFKQIPLRPNCRYYARNNRSEPVARDKLTFKERAMASAGHQAYNVGKGAVAAAAIVGLGALCFYGIGLGKGTSALKNSTVWPDYVRQRIHTTFMYFTGSNIISVLAAMAVFRTPALLDLLIGKSKWAIIGALPSKFFVVGDMSCTCLGHVCWVAMVFGSGILARSIQYREGFGAKQLAWLIHTGFIGGLFAPLCFLGGPLITRAALYTAGVVGSLSTLAACAPSDKFLYMGGALAIGFGFVFTSSIASMFLGPATALGASVNAMSLYGGLILFSGLLLYDIQHIIRYAETHPEKDPEPFDPINVSMSIYLDTINIFVRIVSILADGDNTK